AGASLSDAAIAVSGLRKSYGSHEAVRGIDFAVGRRRAELQADAFALGRRMYAEPPGAFAKRMGAYWRAARPTVHA
ncbi:MAG TPA: hypothetical protein VE780_05865, partial [Thermoleophilaceae bacterium]|nr:hypothetical protein [Thermoleophilaceae bacterium]